MFGFAKGNNLTNNPRIADEIRGCLNQGARDLHVNLWIDDQILFQVMSARHYQERGLECKTNDFAIVHFFNKNKTHTLNAWKKFQENRRENDLFYFEEPKAYHSYINNVGSDPDDIQREIEAAIEYYELEPQRSIRIEYLDY